MTCVIGYIADDIVYIGGDSAGVDGLNVIVRTDEKVFRNGDFLFGFTTSFRMGQILRYNFQLPKRKENISDDEYLYGDFIDAILKILKNKHYAKIDNNQIEGGCFLFGYRGKLYNVSSDFQIAKPSEKFDAVGCGRNYALGCLYCLKDNHEMSILEKIEKALKTAEYFSGGVRSPFYILDLKN